jgi:hypothetical protein
MIRRIQKWFDRTGRFHAGNGLGDAEWVVVLRRLEVRPEIVVSHTPDVIGDPLVVTGGQGSVEGAWRTIFPWN